jgi:type II secretory pathway pseudopilin PulG
VIVVALMVLMVMGSLALLGVRVATNEVRSARNHLVARLSQGVADSSSTLVVAYASTDPLGFSALVDARAFSGTALTLDDLADVAPLAWDLSLTGSLGLLATTFGQPGFTLNADALQTKQLSFFRGSSSGRYCSRLTTWRIRGLLGAQPTGASAGIADTPTYGGREFLVRSQVGPFDCAGQ